MAAQSKIPVRVYLDAPITSVIEGRFWAKVNLKPTARGCLEWTGALRGEEGKKYGNMRVGQVTIHAHRLVYALAHGKRLPQLHVLHKCDNTRCVNAKHLFLGNDMDNARDRAKKGRSYRPIGDLAPARMYPDRVARGARNGSRTHPEKVFRGEGHYRAKLTNKQVQQIRRRHAKGEPSRYLGRRYSISHRMVLLISRREAWAHVP